MDGFTGSSIATRLGVSHPLLATVTNLLMFTALSCQLCRMHNLRSNWNSNKIFADRLRATGLHAIMKYNVPRFGI